mgnify:FL=1
MKEVSKYILSGVIIGTFLYIFGPKMFNSEIQIREVSSDGQSINSNISYHDTVKKVNKSVVSIYTRKALRKDVYFIDPNEKRLKKREYTPTGQGSGIIVSSQGHVITNAHVIAGSNEILIRDYLGIDHPTAVIGIDPLTDLAVLKIEKNLDPITFGDIAVSYTHLTLPTR